MSDHQVRVWTQPGPPGMSASGAECSCGWRSVIARYRSEAEADAREHSLTSDPGRCPGSEVLIGRRGEGYVGADVVQCPSCGQQVAVYTDFGNVRLRDHLRAVA
jgi:hypothetical protein